MGRDDLMPKRKSPRRKPVPRVHRPHQPKSFGEYDDETGTMRITNVPLAMWAIGAGVMPRESACIIAACLREQVNLNPIAHAEAAANGQDLAGLLERNSPSDLVDACTTMVQRGALTRAGWAPGFLDALRQDVGRPDA